MLLRKNLLNLHNPQAGIIYRKMPVTEKLPAGTDIHLIPSDAPLEEALRRLNSLSPRPLILFVTDGEGRLAGSLTDGDIRRSMIAGAGLSTPVIQAANRHFHALRPDDDPLTAVPAARRLRLGLLPVLDAKGVPVRFLELNLGETLLPLSALLMAGGRGERLLPLTLDTPKPLLQVGGRAIIDYNVAKLALCGIKHVFVAVNYLKEQVMDHLASQWSGITFHFLEEPKRLGTLGAASMVEDWLAPDVVVMNADLLTDLSLEDMYSCHRRSGCAATMALTPYNVAVPYAIVDTCGGIVEGISEKPVFNYLANAGVYIMGAELLRQVPRDEFVDAPGFLTGKIGDGVRVGSYTLEGLWLDIGTPEQYRLAHMRASRSGGSL